jgi:hypothetical protein
MGVKGEHQGSDDNKNGLTRTGAVVREPRCRATLSCLALTTVRIRMTTSNKIYDVDEDNLINAAYIRNHGLTGSHCE